MDIKYTTITHQERRHESLMLSWDDVEEALGHKHRGTPEDDAALVAALRAEGVPGWAYDAEGFIDESGWGLIGPELSAMATAPLETMTAKVTAKGKDSTVPDDEGAVDAELSIAGEVVGSVTLLPDPGRFDGGLDTWGSLDNWADSAIAQWIAARVEAGDERDEVIGEIVCAVRAAARSHDDGRA